MIIRLFPIRNVPNAPFSQYILAKELGRGGKFSSDSSLSVGTRSFWGLPNVKKNIKITAFVSLFGYNTMVRNLATSPEKLYAIHHWRDDLIHAHYSPLVYHGKGDTFMYQKHQTRQLDTFSLSWKSSFCWMTPFCIHSSRFFLRNEASVPRTVHIGEQNLKRYSCLSDVRDHHRDVSHFEAEDTAFLWSEHQTCWKMDIVVT